jgi:hypothetical protein
MNSKSIAVVGIVSERRAEHVGTPWLSPIAMSAWLLMVIVLITGCSGANAVRSQNQSGELSRFVEYAVEPVDSFRMVGRLYNWRSLGDDKLVVWTTMTRAYLLTVQPPCNELPFSTGLALTSTGSTVSVGVDSVIVESGKCLIETIRPIDYNRMQEAEKKQADQ